MIDQKAFITAQKAFAENLRRTTMPHGICVHVSLDGSKGVRELPMAAFAINLSGPLADSQLAMMLVIFERQVEMVKKQLMAGGTKMFPGFESRVEEVRKIFGEGEGRDLWSSGVSVRAWDPNVPQEPREHGA